MDIHEIFNDAVKRSITTEDDSEKYYDFDIFLRILEKYDSNRVRSIAERILRKTCEDDPDGFLDTCRWMINGYDETDTMIIKHKFGDVQISGNLPENCELVVRAPQSDHNHIHAGKT